MLVTHLYRCFVHLTLTLMPLMKDYQCSQNLLPGSLPESEDGCVLRSY